MAESDSRNTSGLFEIMRCARRRPSSELNMELLQGKQLPTVLGNRQILSRQREAEEPEVGQYYGGHLQSQFDV